MDETINNSDNNIINPNNSDNIINLNISNY